MQQEIILKHFNTKHKIGIDGNGIAYSLVRGKVEPCKKVVHVGTIHYVVPGIGNRVSHRQIIGGKDTVSDYIVQEYCPF